MKITNFTRTKSISFKIIIGIILILIFALSIWGLFLIISENKILTDQLNSKAKTTTDTAAIFCSHPLLIEDYMILQNYIDKIASVDKNIVMAKILRKDEKVVAQYDSNEINTDNKNSIKLFVASIRDQSPPYDIIGQFVIGISTKKSMKIIIGRIFELILMSLILLLILAVIINLFLNNIITKPIHKLDIFAKELSKGNLNRKINLKQQDEFGRLSINLDRMRKNLKSSYDRIKNQNNELEETVEKRTEVLMQTNKRLEESYQELLDTQTKIIYFAFHDDLTGLSNRKSCKDKLENMINTMGKLNKKIAILFIGLDSFKNINDTLGPSIGDEMLKNVAKRLLLAKNKGDEVARWSSDEFVIMIPDINDNMNAVSASNKILKTINEPFNISDRIIHITTSIGISIFPDDGNDAETLIHKSDSAMHEAKNQGRNRYQLFDMNIYNKILHKLEIAEELKASVIKNQFILYYQPKVNLEGIILGLEALIRWNSKKHGFILPIDFIPIAENSNIIIDIGNWVLKTACEQIKNFQKNNIAPIPISVNLSPRHFKDPKLVKNIKKILKDTNLDPGLLEIEITETSTMENIEQSIKIVEEINKLGIRISIDDFGTGFSSLSKLTQLSFDAIKIDKSFIKYLTNNDYSEITVSSIINLAHNLNKEVVAEGVETKKQFEILKKLKCDLIQGYYFSEPKPIDEIEKLLIKGKIN